MGTIEVQVVPSATQVGQMGGRPVMERLEDRIDELGESIGQIARRLKSRLDADLNSGQEPDPVWRLDEVSLTFSLDLEAEAGVVVARAKTTAGFEVGLTWSRS